MHEERRAIIITTPGRKFQIIPKTVKLGVSFWLVLVFRSSMYAMLYCMNLREPALIHWQ